MTKKSKSKKINFMIRYEIIDAMEKLIPVGKRSEFVNRLLQKGLRNFQNEMALDAIDQMREEANMYVSTEEILKLRDYGRK